jgi:2'-5' RNA ligase
MAEWRNDWIERAVPKRPWVAIVCAVGTVAGLALNLSVVATKIESWGFGLGIASFVVWAVPALFIGWMAVLAVRRASRRGWGPTSEVAIVAPLAPMKVGDTYVLSNVPLHITVLPNARLRGLPADLLDDAQRAAQSHAPFDVVGDRPAMFGPAADIPVTTVVRSESLLALHEELSTAVRRLNGHPVEPRHWGARFSPHVTTTVDGTGLEPGERLRLDRLALIDCTLPTRRVIWVGQLGRATPPRTPSS